jgi:hypothetical protein
MSLPKYTYTYPPTTKPEGYDDLDLVGYLYNACYGGFSFSQEFVRRMNEKRAGATKFDGEKEFTSHSVERTDPMVIELFQEMGPGASSGPHSSIRINWIPREFLPYVSIHEYDGTESVRVVFDEMEADLLQKFLQEWKKDSSLTVENLNQRYMKLQEKIARCKIYQKECWSQKLDY